MAGGEGAAGVGERGVKGRVGLCVRDETRSVLRERCSIPGLRALAAAQH